MTLSLIWFLVASVCGVSPQSTVATAQDETPSRVSERDRITAERFLTVLIRRPRPGTALDRVVEFHTRAGSMDTFLESLIVADDAENAGAKAMVAGLVYLRQGDAAEAARQLDRASTLIPDDSVASYQHGVALIQIGELEKAALALRESIERKPARAEAMQVYTTLAQLYSRAGDRTKSLDVWNDLREQFPSDEKIAARIAEELARSGDAEEARKRFLELSDSARREEDKLRYSVRAAETLRSLGKPEQALEELTTALTRTRPGSWLSRDIVSRIEKGFTATGDFEGLAKHYQKQIESDPENAALPMRLTRIWINLGRLNDAEEVARATLAKMPDNNEVRQSLVDVLQAGGKYSDAAKEQREMLQRDPENTDIAFALANTLAADPEVSIENRRQRAAAVLTAFSERRADDALLLSQIAQKLKDLEQPEEAIRLSRLAVEIDPSSTPYREYLGELLFESGDKDEAIATWRAIAEGDRRNQESLVRLAEIFAAFDLDELSVETWDEAGSFDLDFPTRLRWASALADAELHDRAITVLDNAESIAETPDQRDALLVARINAYKTAGKLKDRIAEVAAEERTAPTLRELAVLYQSDGQESEAMRSITEALQLAPQDLSVLTVAADILKRQNRWAEAAKQFAELAKIDRRYQVNHLKQVVAMRIKLGQNGQAMSVCEQIIESAPGSVESYMFAARTAQRLSRDDDAIEFLRTASDIAPRDNAPRMMLASILSSRFDTDAALELYWEAFEIAEYDERSRIVAALSPLYERRGEVDALMERIALAGRTDRDLNPRRVGLLTADAYQAIRYDGAVLREMEELLLRSPRDVDLLKRALAAADAADDLETAVEYARRLVEQADTPENRIQLASLKWQCGQIEIDEFLKVRLSTLDSPDRISRIITASVIRGDLSTAKKACQFALEKDPTLWDVRLYLAQIDLHELLETLPPPMDVRNLDAEAKAKRREGLRSEIRELCEAFLAESTPGETLPPATKGNPKANPKRVNQWSTWSTTLRDFQRAFRIPPYSDSYYRRQPGTNLIVPLNHAHATAIAGGLLMAAESEEVQVALTESSDFDLDVACKGLAKSMEPWLPKDPEAGSNMVEFLSERFIRSFARNWAEIMAQQSMTGAELAKWNKDAKHGLSLSWNRSLDARFAAARIDLEYGFPDLLSHIRGRISRGVFVRKATEQLASEEDPEKRKALEKEIKAFKPFPVERIEELEAFAAKWKTLKKKNDSSNQIEHQALIWNEWIAADQPERAKPFQLVIDENTNYSRQVQILKWYYQFEWFDKTDEVLPIVLNTIRETKPVRDQVAGYIAIYQTQTWRNPDRYREFVSERYDRLLEISIAQAARSAPSIRNCSLSAEGYFNKSVRNLESRTSYARLRSPLLPSLLPDSLIYDFLYLCDRPSNLPYEERGSIDVPEPLLAVLNQRVENYTDEDLTPPADVDPYETDNEQTRRHLEAQFTHVLAAYVDWWNGQPEEALAKIRRLHALNPKNIALTLELSRLQSETGAPKNAIATLDSFEVLNSDTLLRKELAILNLASMAGDQDRASRAAERLFGMRMDRSMQLALAGQLQQLGMKEKAGEILARARRGRSSSVSTLISLASSLAASDRDNEAAEVAYDAFKRLSNRRSQQSNEDYYRRRAIQILKNSKRLEPIIAAAEKRYEAAPTSGRLRTQLSELYSAAGETKKLEALFADAPEASADPRAQMAQGQNLYQARKYDESAMAYAKAFVGAPTMASNEYYNFQNSFAQASKEAKLESIKMLSKMDFSKVESYRISEFVELCSPNSYYGRQLSELGEDGEKVLIQYLESVLLTLRDSEAKISMLGTIPEKYIDKSEKIKSWFESELLKPSTFGPRNSLANVNSYQGDGTVNGAIERIVTVLSTERMRSRARDTIDKVLAKHPKPAEGVSADHTVGLIYELLLETSIDALDKKESASAAKATSTPKKTDEAGTADDQEDEKWLVKLEAVADGIPDLTVGGTRSESAEGISYSLIWQAAQFLESFDGIPDGNRRDQCFEKLYRYAYVSSDGNQFQYSPGPRWLKFAQKTRPRIEVRDELWRVIRGTDYFRDDAYNPGYGDYQMINAYSAFASQFEKLEFPIDALSLMAELLQDPERFERASRWGGGGTTSEVITARATKQQESITVDEATEYLELLITSWQQRGESASKAEPSVCRVNLATALSSDYSLDFIKAVEILSAEENADALISDIQAKLEEAKSKAPRGVATVQFSLEITSGDESRISAAYDPYVATLAKPIRTGQVVDAAAILRLMSQTPSARPAADRLLTHLVANVENSEDLESNLRRLLQSDEDRRAELITSIESAYEADPNAMIRAAQFDECLQLSMKAAEDGRLADSAELAELMLRRGLPIRTTTQSNVKDAFAIRSSNSSSSRSDREMPRLADIDRILELADLWGKTLGLEEPMTGWPKSFVDLQGTQARYRPYRFFGFSFPSFSGSGSASKSAEPIKATISESDRDAALRVFETLTKIQSVAPTDVPAGFAGRLVTDQLQQFNSRNSGLEFRSLEIARSRLAIAMAMTERLESDSTAAPEASDITTIRQWSESIERAHAQLDEEALSLAIEKLGASLDGQLPGEDEKVKVENVRSYSMEMFTEAANALAPLEAPIRVLLPVANNDQLSKECKRPAIILCKRMLLSMKQQKIPMHYVEGPRQMMQRTIDQLLEDASRETLSKEASNILREVGEQSEQYAGNDYATQYFTGEVRNRIAGLLPGGSSPDPATAQLDLERFNQRRDVLLPLLQASWPTYVNAEAAPDFLVFRYLISVEPEDRVEFLSKLILEPLPDSVQVDPTLVASAPRGSILPLPQSEMMRLPEFMYQDDPDANPFAAAMAFRKQLLTGFDSVTLPRIDDDKLYPVIDMAVVLADSAAQCGKSDVLADKLRKLAKEPGDSANGLLALVLQADAIKNQSQSDELSQLFEGVLDKLREQLEADEEELYESNGGVVPAVRTLVLRAHQTGIPRKATLEDWNLMRDASEGIGYNSYSQGWVSHLRRRFPMPGFEEQVSIEGFATAETFSETPGSNIGPALFHVDGDVHRVWAGNRSANLYVPFPVIGDFTVSFESSNFAEQITTESGEKPDVAVSSMLGYPVTGMDLSYGDVEFSLNANYLPSDDGEEWLVDGGNLNISIRDESSPAFTTDLYRPTDWTVESISVTPQSVSGGLGDKTYVKIDGDPFAFPWIQLNGSYSSENVWKNLRIEGELMIPRYVDLINTRLIGFRPTGPASLPVIEAPQELLAGVGEAEESSDDEYEQQMNFYMSGSEASESILAEWSVDDGVLKLQPTDRPTTETDSASTDVPADVKNLSMVEYQRPLLEGEQIQGRLRIGATDEPSDLPPAYLKIGNVVIRLNTDGVIAVAQRPNQFNVNADRLEVQLAEDGLREGWNDFKIQRREGRIYVELNETPLVDFEVFAGPRYGFGGDARFGVEFSSLRLTGPWPETVPESWKR